MHLCFGTFAKEIQMAMQPPNSQQSVVELLLGFVVEEAGENELRSFSVTPKTASNLMKFIDNIHEDIRALSSSPKVIEAMPGKFASRVAFAPMLLEDLIEKLCQIIESDDSISKSKRTELASLAHKETLSEFLSSAYLYALNKPNKIIGAKTDAEVASEITPMDDMELIHKIFSKYAPPKGLDVPKEPSNEEMEYIAQLLAAYAEAEGIPELSQAQIGRYQRYNNDLRQRRKEYYAAETIRRGTREVFKEDDFEKFEMLKEETYEGIFDVHSKSYPNGYERLLEVMLKVSSIQINKCPLSKLPEWIGAKEKKGVCHILVNEGTIQWVVRDEKYI
jgi:hypothetical protein